MSGDPVRSSGPTRPRWPRVGAGTVTLVLTALGVLVAIGAWLLPVDRDPVATPTPGTPTSGTPTPGTPTPGTPTGSTPPVTATSGSTAGPGGPDRHLADLIPLTGGGTVQRKDAHSLVMPCGTGEADDRQREVGYELPQSGYRTFRTTARPGGQRETRVQVSVFVDGVVAEDPVVTAGGVRPLVVDVDGATRLTLRITCDPGAGPVVFADPGLYR